MSYPEQDIDDYKERIESLLTELDRELDRRQELEAKVAHLERQIEESYNKGYKLGKQHALEARIKITSIQGVGVATDGKSIPILYEEF